MQESFYAKLSDEFLSIEKAANFVDVAANGALNMFVGRVRNLNEGKPVNAVTYEAFTPLAEKVFAEICAEATQKFGQDLRLYMEHFIGRLEVGGISIVIAVGSPHRAASFNACRYLIEELKHRAPIWKNEHYTDGDSGWLDGHSLVEKVNV